MEPKKKPEIKILRFVSRLNIGGPSIHVSILSKHIDHGQFKTLLISGSLSAQEGDMSYVMEDISSDNLSFQYLPELQRKVSPLKDLIAFLKILSIIIQKKPDIVHTHLSKAGALARLAAIIINQFCHYKIKIIHTYHGHVLDGYFGNFKTNLYKKIEKKLGRGTNTIIAISQTQKWELTEKYKIAPKEKVQVINLGFNLNKFIHNQNHGSFRSFVGIDEDTILIGIVGRLVPIKNHFLFLDAAKLTMERNPSRSIQFIIVGDGELRDELEAHTRMIGLSRSVYFHGWEKDVEKIYGTLDILALTSINEGTPVSIIEAMASSVPVITTGVGGVKDLLGDIGPNQNSIKAFKQCERGVLIPTNDPKAFADGIEYMLQNQIDRNHPIVKTAQNYVLNNYSYTRLVRDIESLYLKLVDQ